MGTVGIAGTQRGVQATIVTADHIEAWRHAARANASVPVRDADKRHRILEFLKLPEARSMTQKQIAEVCHVDQSYVSKVSGHEYDSHKSDRLSEGDGLTEMQRRVADVVAANPGMTAEQVSREAGVSKGTVIKTRKKLGLTTTRDPEPDPAPRAARTKSPAAPAAAWVPPRCRG